MVTVKSLQQIVCLLFCIERTVYVGKVERRGRGIIFLFLCSYICVFFMKANVQLSLVWVCVQVQPDAELEAKRDLKPSDSFDSTTGREYVLCDVLCPHLYTQRCVYK